MLVFIFTYVWFRATLPRLRYDQLMDLGWKALIPLAFGWLLIISLLRLARDRDWNVGLAAAIGFAVGALCWLLLAAAIAVAKRNRLEAGGDLLMGYLKGFTVTFKTLFDKRRDDRVPEGQDPEARASARPSRPEPLRGRHGEVHRMRALRWRVPGALHLRAWCRQPVDDPVSPGERYGYVYEINYLRCIHCDLCVEACPTQAITETKLFEFSFTNRSDAIYTKDELLVGDDGKPKQLPWEDWREGDDSNTSAWMRATSPSGDADFEGSRRVVG